MNLMRFKKAKCKVQQLGGGNPLSQHRLGEGWMESSPVKKDLGMQVGDNWDMSWQYVLAAQKAKRLLGCRSREGILPLCSAPLRPPPCVQLWGPQHKTDMDLLKQVQRRPRRWFKGWSSCAAEKG